MKKITIPILLSIFIIILFNVPIFADTLFLKDGTIISGKIIKEDGRLYLFTNFNGSFEVKKIYVTNILITKNYQEDVKAYRDVGKKVDPLKIKKDFDAGMKTLNRKKRGKRTSTDNWNYGRLCFSMAYFSTLMSGIASQRGINEVLPAGINANLAYDQGLEFRQKHYMIPGIKIEHSYLYFTKNLFVDESKEVSGHATYAGLMWAFPGLHSKWGCITIAGMPGASFLFIRNRVTNRSRENITFSFKTTLGYEYQINIFSIQIHFNYNYIIDQTISFHNIGASLGFAFKLW